MRHGLFLGAKEVSNVNVIQRKSVQMDASVKATLQYISTTKMPPLFEVHRIHSYEEWVTLNTILRNSGNDFDVRKVIENKLVLLGQQSVRIY